MILQHHLLPIQNGVEVLRTGGSYLLLNHQLVHFILPSTTRKSQPPRRPQAAPRVHLERR